jgi:hypothetical protein
MAASNTRLKRYNLVLPEKLYDEMYAVASSHHTTVLELMRKFIKLGLLAMELQEKPDASLIIKDGNIEREILML